jgi:hypothetical protein
VTESHTTDGAVSRRNLILGAGAGVVVAGGGFASAADASAALPYLPVAAQPEVLGPVNAALTYVNLDATAFMTDIPAHRRLDNTSGVGILEPPAGGKFISAPLMLPTGSLIRQVNVAFMGQPIFEILRRNMNSPTPPQQLNQQTLAAGAMAKTQTLEFDGVSGSPVLSPITIEQAHTYSLRFFCLAVDSVYGVTVGYTPPTQRFVPFTGADPRVLDTRTAGGGGKLLPAAERVVNMGMPGARSAVFNLAITETEVSPGSPGGFVAAFRADIAWPGNASINWAGANVNLSNGVICALDATGQLKIRGGANPTHVVIDRIGYLV